LDGKSAASNERAKPKKSGDSNVVIAVPTALEAKSYITTTQPTSSSQKKKVYLFIFFFILNS
jgi:hypothetical protein